MNVLVVGGAGYIGSHMVRQLALQGHAVVSLDNLSTGFAEAVTAGELVVGELSNQELVCDILKTHQIDAVMHFAACALVGESVVDPAKYYTNNVCASISLLESMRQCEVNNIVFSSTCATYGVPESTPISEQTPQKPVNPYGRTKLVIEQALQDYHEAYGLRFAALRYFNAAGADPSGEIGEDHNPESHLIPIVLQAALGQRESVSVFGNDWPTKDGTCVRDYIHVNDLGRAHLAALEHLEVDPVIKVNLGTGVGFSVLEIIEACRKVTGREIKVVQGPRRAGDPPALVAEASLAKSKLGWEPEYRQPEPIIQTAWNWHSKHPDGYKSSNSVS